MSMSSNTRVHVCVEEFKKCMSLRKKSQKKHTHTRNRAHVPVGFFSTDHVGGKWAARKQKNPSEEGIRKSRKKCRSVHTRHVFFQTIPSSRCDSLPPPPPNSNPKPQMCSLSRRSRISGPPRRKGGAEVGGELTQTPNKFPVGGGMVTTPNSKLVFGKAS